MKGHENKAAALKENDKEYSTACLFATHTKFMYTLGAQAGTFERSAKITPEGNSVTVHYRHLPAE